MTFHLVTIFPDFFGGILSNGIVGKAIEAGLVHVRMHNLRDWTHDRHKTVDDRPFGGGEGMLMKCEPLFDAVESILPERTERQRVILLSAQGRKFDQEAARRLSTYDDLVFLCGRYEGVDERVAEHLADEEISIGDFVLSGGELAAALILDSVARLVPGVLGNEASTENESFNRVLPDGTRLLDCPQYTRPAVFRGYPVPDVLLSGHHAEIVRWRQEAALDKTRRMRPDLLP
ncbi:MAG: tRNA (guanosine(37)-N1)-methyltransferase TrmD [Acidobacteriota bacterium]